MFRVLKTSYLPDNKMLGLRLGRVIWAGTIGQPIPSNLDSILLSARDYDLFHRQVQNFNQGDSHEHPATKRPDGDPTPDADGARADHGRPPSTGDPAES